MSKLHFLSTSKFVNLFLDLKNQNMNFLFVIKIEFAYKPSLASSYDFLVPFFEISIENYIESWGQTFGTPDFDLQVPSVLASGSKVLRVEKIKNHNSNRSIWGCYQRMSR